MILVRLQICLNSACFVEPIHETPWENPDLSIKNAIRALSSLLGRIHVKKKSHGAFFCLLSQFSLQQRILVGHQGVPEYSRRISVRVSVFYLRYFYVFLFLC